MNLNQVINNLPREYRVPVAQAVDLADGTPSSIEAELNSIRWEYPDLPVDEILGLLTA